MKKIVTLGVLSLGILFLAGCGQQPVSQTQPTTPAPAVQKPTQPVVTQPVPATPPAITNETIAKGLLEKKNGVNTIKSISSLQSAENYMRGEFDAVPSKEDLDNGRDSGGGGIFLAAKVNGEWKLVFDGNGQIECKIVKPYNFPSNMISDCTN